MIKNLAALVVGILFGVGLNISQMTNPEKVLAFLNVLGDWDPSLALVMVSALIVAGLGFIIAKKMKKPIFDSQFSWPNKTVIDKPLILGASLFGVGWGMVGLCPGPAIASLAAPSTEILLFLISMLVGMGIAKYITR